MSDVIELWGFGDNDRSSKVRWTAAELGLTVDDRRLRPPEHRRPPYTELNPFEHVPTAVFRGETLYESTAICETLADAVDEPKLRVDRDEPGRNRYLYWKSLFAETHEARLVECAVSRAGIVGPEYFDLHESGLRRKLAVTAEQLPSEGWLCGDRFTVADVCAGYSLRLAIQTGLVERDAVEPYFGRLVARPGAVRGRIFASLSDAG